MKAKSTVMKAVIPVAGRGKRVMPLSVHQPKAMISVVDRPVLHYVIDEAIAGGANHIILVISPYQKTSIKKYLDFLQADPEWKRVQFSTAVQKEPLGNGHAILAASRFIKNEPFFVLWSDDILAPHADHIPLMRSLADHYEDTRAPAIALETVPKKDVSRYGVVAAKKAPGFKNAYMISDIVEKPPAHKAPSRLTVAGRYLLTSNIMKNLKTLVEKKKFVHGEIWLTDALKMHIKQGHKLYGWEYPHTRFDCGSKMGIVKAQTYFAMHHKDFKKEFRKYLKNIGA